MIRTLLAGLASASLMSPALLAETPAGAARQLAEFLDQVPAGPGYAVTVVTADEVLLSRASGVRHFENQTPLTTRTPIYIASQTKAYLGLLAAALDERGILSLDTTLDAYWGEVDFPDGFDPSDYTLRDLLHHNVPLEIDMIVEVEAYSARLAPEHYPLFIETFAETRKTGYSYDNLGYNLYGAILETQTGKTWQDWLDDVIFDPMGWDYTSARTSDFPLEDLAWSHIWQGEDEGWAMIRPKTDGMMQSAGGLVTSVEDMAAWLQLNLRGEGPAGSGLTSSMLETAQAPGVETHMEDRRNAAELPCSHYSLGWNICDFEGHTLYVHGGGYTGNRTMMAFSPDLGVGVAAFSNSDNQTGWFTSRTINMYLQFLTEHEQADRYRELRIEQYPVRSARSLAYRTEQRDNRRAEELWDGWNWQPTEAELAEYVGVYDSGLPYLNLRIEPGENGLVLHWNEAVMPLEPARTDLFGAEGAVFYGIDSVEFHRDESGQITHVNWREYDLPRR